MKGKIKTQRGIRHLRPYAPGMPVSEVQRRYGLQDVIKLASNENPLGSSPEAVEAVRAALPGMNMYPDSQSYDLRHRLAEQLGVDAEIVTVGNGADGLIMQICMAYLEEGCEVVTSRSSFPVYDIYVNVMRAKLFKTPLKGYALDLDAMASAIGPRTRLVFVCNPNNPTGLIVTATELEAFLETVPEHVLVVLDEAYHEFVSAPEYPDSVAYLKAGRPNIMILRTFSKAHGLAGLRLGYAIAPPEILAPMNAVKEPFAVNLAAQVAGMAALADMEFIERAVAANEAGREYLYREFDRLGVRYLQSQGNFVMVEIGPSAAALQQAMLERGVIIRHCGAYDLPHCLRITVGNATQNARLVAASEELLSQG